MAATAEHPCAPRQPAIPPREPVAIESTVAHVLGAVCRSGVSVSVWNRPLPREVRHAMAGVQALMPVHRTFTVSPSEDARALLSEAIRAFPGLSETSARAWGGDLALLLSLARSIAPASPLRVRLETKANDACRLFHADNVALRVICTYRGAGTQWLPVQAVDRNRLSDAAQDRPSSIREIGTGAVAVMKGLKYPDGGDHALVHRSPPADAVQPRVVAVVDILI